MEVIQGDLRDPDAVAKAAMGVSTVYHLGAIIPIPYSYIHPREVIETNVMGTLNILTAARDHGNIRVVHTSTSEVYGTAQYTPDDERLQQRFKVLADGMDVGVNPRAGRDFLRKHRYLLGENDTDLRPSSL